ncbi:MAG: endolytic transglycosylase MltG [Bacteroidales bacterium]|nr:endolytic transglycosylase MltG [Bacteroidales bacterium]
MIKKILLCSAAAVLLIGIILASDYYNTYKRDNIGKETVILIYKDYNYDSLINAIKESGALLNFKRFEKAAKKSEFEKHFEPGRYILKPGMGNRQIIRTISNGWQEPLRFTLRSHIRTISRLSSFLGENFEADSAQFSQALLNDTIYKKLGFKKETVISMFIPNTYEIYWTISPENFIERMYKEYNNFWTPSRVEKAQSLKMTKDEIMTLASIVNEETNNTGEMPKIAGVYINRLKRGMPLQACPTVIYAHLDTEPGIKRVLKRHLRIDSPYNTYKNKGLPPGPITIPTIKAIDAVLNYEKSNYLYFCAKPEFDGTHNFATTYTKHQQHSRAYQKALSNLKN